MERSFDEKIDAAGILDIEERAGDTFVFTRAEIVQIKAFYAAELAATQQALATAEQERDQMSQAAQFFMERSMVDRSDA